MSVSKPGSRFLTKIYGGSQPKDTKKLYREWAKSYDDEVVRENNYAQPKRCAIALRAALKSFDGHILDVGCGTGLSGLALKEIGFSTIDGCDFSEEMLELAEAKEIYKRTFFADLNSPPIDAPDQYFDGATAVGVFAYDHIDPNSIDEILRVQKPGAPLIIGLNENFYDKGTLEDKFGQLENDGKARIVSRQLGEHLPGAGIKGWVIDLRKFG